MRPSDTSAADGDAVASSSQSEATRAVLLLRPGAVHQHRVLLDRAGQVGERPELPRRGRILAEPVVAQSQQLPHRGRVGVRVAQRTQDAHRVAFVAGVDRLGRARELLHRAVRHRDPRADAAPRWPPSNATDAGGARWPCGCRRSSWRRARRSPRPVHLAERGPRRRGGRRRLRLVAPAVARARILDPAARRIAVVGVARSSLVRARGRTTTCASGARASRASVGTTAPAASAAAVAGFGERLGSRCSTGPHARRDGPGRRCRAHRDAPRNGPPPVTARRSCGCRPNGWARRVTASRPVRASGRPRPAPEPWDPLERGAGRPLAVAAPRLGTRPGSRCRGGPGARPCVATTPDSVAARSRRPPDRAPPLPRESGRPGQFAEACLELHRGAGLRGGSSTTGPVVGGASRYRAQ